jgi:exostosin family protein
MSDIKNKMKNIYLPKLLQNVSYIPILYPQLGIQSKKTSLYQENFIGFNEPFFNIVDQINDADFIIIPHEYILLKKINKKYLDKLQKISEEFKIPLILYVAGDFNEEIDMPNTLILRASKETKKLKKGEFIMPSLVDDLSPEGGFEPLNKKAIVPIIGFCGWASFNSYSLFFRAVVKNLVRGMRNIVTRGYFYGPDRNGVFFRKKILRKLSMSKLIKSNFITRTSFGKNKNTINIDPKIAREEFIKNIKESDFSLAVRGYGNFSIRFYEILSAGRIPIFIDTDSPLPLENVIDYSKIMLRIDYRDINKLDQIISDFYNNITDDEFVGMQKEARSIYKKYLRAKSFYKYFFEQPKEDLIKTCFKK